MLRNLKTTLVWILVGMGMALTFHWLETRRRPTEFQAHGDVVEIRRGDDGHYHWPGTIDGHAVVFLIDTGATSTAMSSQLARELALESLGEVQSRTAGGIVTGQRVRADITLRGGVKVTALRAVALPELGEHPLLGMDVLRRLRWQQHNDVLSFDLRSASASPTTPSKADPP